MRIKTTAGPSTASRRVTRRLAGAVGVAAAVRGRTSRRMLAAIAVAAGGVLFWAAPASASPGNCNSGYGGLHTTGYISCNSGTGQYRARVTCDNENPFGDDYYRYGAWMSVGSGSSIAACSNGDFAYNLWTQVIGPIR
jgi:hypothetical protein